MSMVSPEFYDKDRNSRYPIIVSYLITEGRPPLGRPPLRENATRSSVKSIGNDGTGGGNLGGF